MLEEARAFALAAHGDQRYGSRPYVVHLDAVAELLAPYGNEAQVIAYLHDVVEDTAVTEGEVRARFGAPIADCVALLTDAPGATRAERKAATYSRLARVNGEGELALLVKVADRLANVRACQRDDGQHARRLREVYRDEYPAFRQAAYRPGLCEPFWAELDRLLAGAGSTPDAPASRAPA
ncbi:MAG: HD domain-containing protein [Candidatus Accumulibacter sp.]|uniref:HD domain-containing protein n=1 Tax=Accumulibacter sp. TaxID=2053492 RepID=UPI002878FE11|nr:HD domain-containing protein [Accumulibacter sp.]MDS4016392.1 HD domain-containing protein [Accumulibacter sp.]